MDCELPTWMSPSTKALCHEFLSRIIELANFFLSLHYHEFANFRIFFLVFIVPNLRIIELFFLSLHCPEFANYRIIFSKSFLSRIFEFSNYFSESSLSRICELSNCFPESSLSRIIEL